MENIQLAFDKSAMEVEKLQALAEEEKERNEDPQLTNKQKEKTNNLQQDHNKLQTDIKVAENRIADLKLREKILLDQINDLLKDKRKVDKLNMELEDEISGKNVTEEMQKKKYKDEERKMIIK